MSDFSKNRVLALYKILLNNTDEQHPISMKGILDLMAAEGYKCSEDSVLRYIKQLRNELGVDIISCRGRNANYFIGERFLEKEEIKLLIDSINASNFIEKNIATKMISKLKGTLSFYDSVELDRTTLGVNITKADNTKILYNVNLLHEALKKGKQISFDYMHWNKKKKLVKKHETRTWLSPWALIWANDRYYLYGYKEDENGGLLERHYRVDKMEKIELLNEERNGESLYKKFNSSTYVSRRMGMFGGEETRITVKVPEDLVGAFIDQFGKEIEVVDTNNKLRISFNAAPTQILFGWLIGLKGVEIVEPENVRKKMIEIVETNIYTYKKN